MKNNITIRIQYHADNYTMVVNNVTEALNTFAQLMKQRDGFFEEEAAHVSIEM